MCSKLEGKIMFAGETTDTISFELHHEETCFLHVQHV